MLVVRDNLAIDLDNCTDFYVDTALNTNRIVVCISMSAEQRSCSYWNQLEYTDQKSMFKDFQEIIKFYSQNEKVCEL